jgi:type VI secretion system secreted protein Hcp
MAFDCFLYITGQSTSGLKVEGETTDEHFKSKKAIEIYSFSFGASNPTTVGSASVGSGGGKVSMSSFNFMKKTDAASPALFKTCAEGSHFDLMTVVLRKSGGKKIEFIRYNFSQVFIDSIQWSGSTGGDDSPTESVSASFGSFNLTYWAQDKNGARVEKPNSVEWSIVTNQPKFDGTPELK